MPNLETNVSSFRPAAALPIRRGALADGAGRSVADVPGPPAPRIPVPVRPSGDLTRRLNGVTGFSFAAVAATDDAAFCVGAKRADRGLLAIVHCGDGNTGKWQRRVTGHYRK